MDSPEMFAFKSGIPSKEASELAIKIFEECHNRVKNTILTYMDMCEENAEIVTLWILGTYLHKEFNSFPRLFINAMKGSGKTRLLQLIQALAWNGSLQISLTEAGLFRNASKKTILFDESEGISSKEKGALRELLCAGYKKGMKVDRLTKMTINKTEEYVNDSYDLYSPVALANINGLDDVLESRCIKIILEKSNDNVKTKLIEDFTTNEFILDLKKSLTLCSVYICNVMKAKNNIYNTIYNIYINTTHTTHTTNTTGIFHEKPILKDFNVDLLQIDENDLKFFDSVGSVELNGRNLELFFPLFVIANMINPECLENIKVSAKEITKDKEEQDQLQSPDRALIEFVSKQEQTLNYVPTNEILRAFREFYGTDEQMINSQWIGKALIRLGLSIDSKRKSKGTEHILNVAKARAKV